MKHNIRQCFLTVYTAPESDEIPSQPVFLLRPAKNYSLLLSFDKEVPIPLTEVRKKIFLEDVFNVLAMTHSNMSPAHKLFWPDKLCGNRFRLN